MTSSIIKVSRKSGFFANAVKLWMVSDMRFCSALGKLMQKYVVASWSARACVVEWIYRASQTQL